jgi:hypothetical protein
MPAMYPADCAFFRRVQESDPTLIALSQRGVFHCDLEIRTITYTPMTHPLYASLQFDGEDALHTFIASQLGGQKSR